MYNNHFGFSESPFNITPNARFYFRTQSCDEILKIVRHGIESRKGVVVVTGESGTGKTLFLKSLERDLHANVTAVIVQNPRTNFDRMLELVLNRLGLDGVADDRTARLDHLTGHLLEQRGQGRIVCLLIDEAQDLDANTLDELRLLTNLEFEGDALLPIVLIGQPELNLKLDHPLAMRMKQRIALTRSTYPLVRMEIELYIRSRLRVAGYPKSDLFDPEALEAIADYSGGIPRMVNSICDNSLIRAYTTNQHGISAEIIEHVARELRIAAPCSLARQFARATATEMTTDSALATDEAVFGIDRLEASPPDHRTADFVKTETRVRSMPPTQDWHAPIFPSLEAQDIRRKPQASTPAGVIATSKTAIEPSESTTGPADFNGRTGIFRDLLPMSVHWHTVAAAAGLILLVLNIFGSSQAPGVYSAASTARRATPVNASSYQSLHAEATDGVEFVGTLVALSPSHPISLAPQSLELGAARAREPIRAAPKNAPENGNGKPAPGKASQPEWPRDNQPQHDNADGFGGANGNRREKPAKTLTVVATSLLRKSPSASAEILSSLEPGSRVTVLAQSGDFYHIHIRSMDKKPIRGYVHREDAFFERKK